MQFFIKIIMDFTRIGKLYHVVMFVFYVTTISYNVLTIPLTRFQRGYAGRFKNLTFIDSVNIINLLPIADFVGNEE